MARIHSSSGLMVTELGEGWALTLSPPGAWADPAAALAFGDWHPAAVPGTAASALDALGFWSRESPTPLHDQDIWYRTTIAQDGAALLRFDGLATFADVWLAGVPILQSASMFEAHEVAVDLRGGDLLVIAFRSLTAALDALKGPRARWRTRMVEDGKLRFVRTSFLGQTPGWCPPYHVVGPWRPVSLVQATGRARPSSQWADLRSRFDGRDGTLDIALAIDRATGPDVPSLHCGNAMTPLTQDGDGLWRATLRLPNVEPWWPHTHGTPRLYPVKVEIAGGTIDLGRTGFRTIAVDRGADGRDFTILVNGVRIFCRGACWTPVDPVGLDGRSETLRLALAQVRDFNANMLRIGGTTVYEASTFYEICDELGILVWQDCMFANLDYPTDDASLASVRREVGGFLQRTQASPSLAILCGGSEVQQQAAMMGLPERMRTHAIFDIELPAILAEHRPDVTYVPGSPSGGVLPFVADGGPSHYYGVGAYNLPLEDARRAGVRFASECLTFANVPEDATLRTFALDPVADPGRWAARVPRDNGAAWDFEDTRHHYMTRLYDVDCAALRADDPQRYLDLSRAVTAEVTERTFDEWRRPGSVTAGGLVWFWRDFWPGAGWGVVDSTGRPKSNAYAMRRAFAPLRLSISDEGVNGLAVHCVNDSDTPVSGEITLTCLRDGAMRVMEGRSSVEVPARGGLTLSSFALFGVFFDAGHVYRFGPPSHDMVHALLRRDETVLAEAVWLLDAARHSIHDVAPTLELDRVDGGWVLTLTARRALHGVTVADLALVPDDNWFSLVPGAPKRVRLTLPTAAAGQAPSGQVRALNLSRPALYGEAPRR